MTEKTDEQIAKEKAAVDAMRNAKGNMETALARIATLESALTNAKSAMARFKEYIPSGAYVYTTGTSPQKLCKTAVDEAIAEASKALG